MAWTFFYFWSFFVCVCGFFFVCLFGVFSLKPPWITSFYCLFLYPFTLVHGIVVVVVVIAVLLPSFSYLLCLLLLLLHIAVELFRQVHYKVCICFNISFFFSLTFVVVVVVVFLKFNSVVAAASSAYLFGFMPHENVRAVIMAYKIISAIKVLLTLQDTLFEWNYKLKSVLI